MTRFRFLLAALLFVSWTPLGAHTSPNTEIRLDLDSGSLTARIIVPGGDYASVTGNAVADEPAALNQAAQEVAARFSIVSGDGRKWLIRVDKVNFTASMGPADLNVVVTAKPPPGAPTQSIDLGWDMFPDDAPGHIAMVMMVAEGEDVADPEETVKGALTTRSRTLAMELGGVVRAVPPEPPAPIEATDPPAAVPTLSLLAAIAIAALVASAMFVALTRSRTRQRKRGGTPHP